MDDDRIDFSALDPTHDNDRFGRLVGSIMEESAEELAARKAATSPLMLVVNWKRPMLATAAVLAMISVGVLWQVEPREVEEDTIGIAEAIGVPSLLAQGMRNNEMPSTAELFEALQEIQ